MSPIFRIKNGFQTQVTAIIRIYLPIQSQWVYRYTYQVFRHLCAYTKKRKIMPLYEYEEKKYKTHADSPINNTMIVLYNGPDK